jgi:hypothetical protein
MCLLLPTFTLATFSDAVPVVAADALWPIRAIAPAAAMIVAAVICLNLDIKFLLFVYALKARCLLPEKDVATLNSFPSA